MRRRGLGNEQAGTMWSLVISACVGEACFCAHRWGNSSFQCGPKAVSRGPPRTSAVLDNAFMSVPAHTLSHISRCLSQVCGGPCHQGWPCWWLGYPGWLSHGTWASCPLKHPGEPARIPNKADWWNAAETQAASPRRSPGPFMLRTTGWLGLMELLPIEKAFLRKTWTHLPHSLLSPRRFGANQTTVPNRAHSTVTTGAANTGLQYPFTFLWNSILDWGSDAYEDLTKTEMSEFTDAGPPNERGGNGGCLIWHRKGKNQDKDICSKRNNQNLCTCVLCHCVF